jgi:hypothetical protein
MHGGTATTDRRDAPTMAGLLRGGRLPQADASPAARRATRARRRRQMPLLRPRAEWCAPGHQTTSQDTRPARGSRPMTTGAPTWRAPWSTPPHRPTPPPAPGGVQGLVAANAGVAGGGLPSMPAGVAPGGRRASPPVAWARGPKPRRARAWAPPARSLARPRGRGPSPPPPGGSGATIPPASNPARAAEGRPVVAQISGRNPGETGLVQVAYVVSDTRKRQAEDGVAHIVQVGRGERRAPAKILGVELPVAAQRAGQTRQQARALRDMVDGEPADDGVEGGIRERVGEGIPTHVGDVLPESAAGNETGSDRVQIALQLQRSDVAAHGAGQVARRTAKAGADIEDVTCRAKAEQVSGRVHSVCAVVVVLVKGEQLLGRQRIVVAIPSSASSLSI